MNTETKGKVINLLQIAKLVENKKVRRLKLNQLLPLIEYLDKKNFSKNSIFSEEISEMRKQVHVATVIRLQAERDYSKMANKEHAAKTACSDLKLIREQNFRFAEAQAREGIDDVAVPYCSNILAKRISIFLSSYIEDNIRKGFHVSKEQNYKLREYCNELKNYFIWIKATAANYYNQLREYAHKIHLLHNELIVIDFSENFLETITGTDD